LDSVNTITDVDNKMSQALDLSEVDQILIGDMFDYILPDFRSPLNSPARQPAYDPNSHHPSIALHAYCDTFLNVLEAGFGFDKALSATIYAPSIQKPLPVQLIAVHLNLPERERIVVANVEEKHLLERLGDLYTSVLQSPADMSSGVIYRRVLRTYEVIDVERQQVPTVFLVKPNELRYWLRSVALQDADQVAADMMLWSHDFSFSQMTTNA
jgi:hypothetical protein